MWTADSFHIEKDIRKYVQEEDAKPTLEPTAGDRGQNYRNRRGKPLC